MKKLKRVVIKEELIALTGDSISAIILGQCIYWSEIVNEMDRESSLKAENYKKVGAEDKAEKELLKVRNGWFWKSAKEFNEEIMISSRGTVDRRLKQLVSQKFVECKKPDIRYRNGKTDNTNRYRVNLEFVQKELLKLGYSLDGYSIDQPLPQSHAQNKQEGKALTQSLDHSEQIFDHHEQGLAQSEQTLTEITTENTYPEITKKESINQSKIDELNGLQLPTKIKQILKQNTNRLIDDSVSLLEIDLFYNSRSNQLSDSDFSIILNNVLAKTKGKIGDISSLLASSSYNYTMANYQVDDAGESECGTYKSIGYDWLNN
ncbi:hypothetical protein [Salipaludibacillus sp. CF4.18]|uniref:hypothetical protein n=1 Tax=Salipaludibacillus sp. CF4.18 TaxID=3373081 RepID=UPI003EE48B91